MKQLVYVFCLMLFTGVAHAGYIFLSKIPLECEKTKPVLSNVAVPGHFKLNPYEAHQKAVSAKTVIKPCASKLEQVIYRDETNYYFTNSVLLVGKMGFPKKVVVVNATTGEVEDRF